MAYRWHPKLAEVDPDSPNAWGTCDKCGFVTNVSKMVWQYSYRGTAIPQNTRVLTCGRPTCLDELNPQDMPYILPPDPLPIFNARPENYQIDESGPTQELACEIVTTETAITTFYLDLYDADPDQGGVSVLETLTGSATRTNYASSMTTTGTTVTNTTAITITTSAEDTADVVWVVIFDAATAGNILMDGPLAPPQTVTMWNGAQFAVGALDVALDATQLQLTWGADQLTWDVLDLTWG